MASIRSIVRCVKDDAAKLLDPNIIMQACDAAKHHWRVRTFDPLVAVSVMLLQVLHATSCRGALRAAKLTASAGAYCKAKQRLPVQVLEYLLATINKKIALQTAGSSSSRSSSSNARWHGHRVVLVDGSSASMPDTPELQNAFGHPGNQKRGCGFPVMHLLALFDQVTGTIIEMLMNHGHSHDMAHVSKLHPKLQPGDVLLGDRGFCSYAHLCLLYKGKLEGVLRLHQRHIVNFKPFRKCQSQLPKAKRTGKPTSRYIKQLGKCDQLVEYIKPTSCPAWMNASDYLALPDTIVVRELRYAYRTRKGRVKQMVLVTTLLDAERYSKRALQKLYESRWQVETRLAEFKRTLGAHVLPSTTEQGVKKDVLTHMIVFNLIRLMMARHAAARGVAATRISFIDARDVMRFAKHDDSIPRLILNPIRPGRDEPRVIKRRKDQYTVMTKPRETLRQTKAAKRLVA